MLYSKQFTCNKVVDKAIITFVRINNNDTTYFLDTLEQVCMHFTCNFSLKLVRIYLC